MSRSKNVDFRHSEQAGSASLLQTLESSLDDLRSIITCRICIRPLYEPYTVACGHTFCYGCLRQWFERDPRKKTCPDCRTEVTREPAPSYLVSWPLCIRYILSPFIFLAASGYHPNIRQSPGVDTTRRNHRRASRPSARGSEPC